MENYPARPTHSSPEKLNSIYLIIKVNMEIIISGLSYLIYQNPVGIAGHGKQSGQLVPHARTKT